MQPQWKRAARAAALIVITALVACKKPVAEESAPEPPIAEATPPPAPATTPAPVAVAPPEPNYFAPAGVFYLVAQTSVETSDGIVGLKPGTRLQQIGPGRYTAEGHELELRDHQVTNDLRIAQRIVGADQAAQAALRQSMQAAEAAAARTVAITAPKATPDTVVARGQSTAPVTSSRPTSLGSSGAFGKTKSQDGWIWQMDGNGNWQPIRPDR